MYARFSPYHFHRIFTALTGETPGDAVHRLRLEKAANMLRKSTVGITEIALSCGFSSAAAFARAFRQHFGTTAGEYRASGGALAPAGEPQSAGVAFPGPAEISVQRLESIPVIYAANREGYSIDKINAAWQRVTRWAAARGLVNPQTSALGITFDDPWITRQNRCRYYACLSVAGPVETGQRIGYLEIAAGLHAVWRVTCRAEEIQSIYHTFYGLWLPGSGFQPAAEPAYEIYLQTPERHPEGKYELQVCLPVEKAR